MGLAFCANEPNDPVGTTDFIYAHTTIGTGIEEVNGFSITGYRGADSVVFIPSIIENLPVISISDNAFGRNFIDISLTGVTIPDSVMSIGHSAFSGHWLDSITIGKGVTWIGVDVFAGNQSSNSMNMTRTSVSIPGNLSHIGNGAFSYCRLASITIGNGVTSIGEKAFAWNYLPSVTIPDSVTWIGDYAFEGNHLLSVSIGNSVTHIGNYAFSGNWTMIDSSNNLPSVIIPNSVLYIGHGAFYRNNLTSVTIGSGVSRIGDNAFSLNPLTEITIGANVVLTGGTEWPSFGYGFDDFYNQRKEAGTYTRPDEYSTVWTKQ